MIKIKNIYYMLAYAFSVLNEDGYKKMASEEFEHVADLFAAILEKGISNQIRRGLGKEYISRTDLLRSPRGRIDVSASVKGQTILKKHLVCEFDEYSENAYINQILKTTALLLLRSPDVENRQKHTLKKVMFYFHNVDELNPRHIGWPGIKYNCNNATYKMLINICYLVICGMLLSDQEGAMKLSQYIDDQRMHSLYERFLLQYYRKHYSELKVSAAHIDWNVDDGVIDFLPIMKSDITLEYGGKTLIIDAKYYSRTMQRNDQYNTRKIHSGNLYQIFTYVKNKDIAGNGNVGGVLLYAKTDEEITPDNDYIMSGNKFSVKTLDLDKDFFIVERQLKSIVEDYFGDIH
jgi:5-methylcytosine-specific restriction enzyme subunit McrC